MTVCVTCCVLCVLHVMRKILVIVGPTASGKTKLAVQLANIFDGEIVSADSRQVYRGMDVGTGKDLINYQLSVFNDQLQKFEVKQILYHLIDVVDPMEDFSLARYQQLAYVAIDDILARGKLPIIVGGSGLYVQSIVDGYELSFIAPNKELRDKLEKQSVEELFSELKKINPEVAIKLNESDAKNKRRLIRYIEIDTQCSIVNDQRANLTQNKKSKYKSLIINIQTPKKILYERIYKRLIERLEKEDMIGEVERLNKQGVSWSRLERFGLEYKYIALYLQKKLSYDDMVDQLFIAIRQFAKRQKTWFRRQLSTINFQCSVIDF